MKTPFISIVVPMYNSQETIGSCLDSLIKMHYPKKRLEIIIIDDHSIDNSFGIVSNFIKNHKEIKIKLIKQKKGKKGPAAARNLGIKHSKGEFIASTDSDEIMFPNWLNELLPYFSNANTAAVGALLIEKHPLDKGISPKIQSILINPTDKPSTVAAGNVIYRKKILQEAGMFNEFCKFNDLDVDLHYRMQEKGFNLIPVQEYLGQHKQRHSLKAFYKRMKGFGAAGIIISFFNFKSALKNKFKNQQPVLYYFGFFLCLLLYSILLITSIFLNIKITYLLILIGFAIIICSSLISASLAIKRTKSRIKYLPITSFYVLTKIIGLTYGVFYGVFYYLRRKK